MENDLKFCFTKERFTGLFFDSCEHFNSCVLFSLSKHIPKAENDTGNELSDLLLARKHVS